ncbi:hypothetical protein [[Limnothrix rosea] IAM M-220]|uniref:hypothetical protein n=1 Tax=[Limnothrix rosea] IAM M-220 TaxID=454133 RepID=UPI0009695712|nr:hypothetical protein [[Limnothrix rosea] IAM M-220]OKH18782.1 hypothetical protein NIES208_04820 [[Limnothrix rosea] IAM M-220]
MQSDEIYRLAQGGNPRAIAEILKAQFRDQGIRVIVKTPAEKQLNIVFESSTTPDQQHIQTQLQALQSHWQKHLTLKITATGFRFGELEPDWEWAIAKGLLSSEERQQSSENLALIQKTPEVQQKRSALAVQLQKILEPQLWHSQITQTKNALVIKLNVIKNIDRRHCRQVIQTAVQALDSPEIKKVYLNVYHRQKQQYLWKEAFDPNDDFDTNIAVSPSPQKQRRSPTQDTLKALTIGISCSIAIFIVPLSRFILNAFLTFVHELGHAAAYWTFGYPAVPSFDFIFGGGITLALNQAPILAIAIYGLLSYIAFQYRHNRNTLIILASITVIHLLSLLSPLHQTLIITMGHIAELMAIFICGYCALGKYFCYVGGEQTIYAMLASFSFLESCSFFGQLTFSNSFRIAYRVGKGGLLDNDLVRLSNDYLSLGLAEIACIFLLATIMMPLATWYAFHYEPLWIMKFYRLCQRNPDSKPGL